MPSFSSSSRKPGWLAILPRGDRLTLAHGLRQAGRRPEIAMLDMFEAGENERAALARLKSARSLKSYRCTTLMGEGEYQFTQADTPSVPREERREALRWSLRGFVDYPLETACLDALDVPNGDQAGRAAHVLVVSAAESAVRARAAPFEEAGVPLAAIDVPELAQRNVATLLEDENRGLALLHLGENGSLLTLTWRGELVAARRGELASRHLSADDPARLERSRERVVVEMQRNLDNFDRQYSYIPVSKVVLAIYPRVKGLAAELAENIYAPVQEMDLTGVVDFPNVPELRDPACQAMNLLAIGAALRTGEA
ncbi:MAG: hypothetical protein LBI87_01570 [Candidatus Accumulibacter sp.]|jgi:MSHA biogenesis protein MshI|nr:hypothetical protein [Accumulibacter sp.]